MANQPAHEWNANLFFEVEKASRQAITSAQTIIKNANCKNPQIISFEDPVMVVNDLSNLVCTLLEVAEEQGVTSEMIARLMGKRAGGREQAVHRLLPQVKKESKLEMKVSKALTIPRLDQKAADIAAGKCHPKSKGKNKGRKSARASAIEDADTKCFKDAIQEPEKAEDDSCAEAIMETIDSKKRRRLESTTPAMSTKSDGGSENKRAAREE